MRVVESLCVGKGPDPAACEDALLVTPDFVVVCDGVTAKVPGTVAGMSRGRYAAQLVVEVVSALPTGAALGDFLTAVRERFAAAYAADGSVGIPEVVRRIQTCAAVLSVARREVWVVGDCQVLVDGREVVDTRIALESVTAAARGLFLEAALVRGAAEADLLADDPSQVHLRPFVACGVEFGNREHPLGFGVLDGTEVPLSLIPVIDVSAATEVVLATDGYPTLLPTLAASEAALARTLADDPLCIRTNPATKGLVAGQTSFDDRTYVRVRMDS